MLISIVTCCEKYKLKILIFLFFSSETVFSGVRHTKTLMAVFHDGSYQITKPWADNFLLELT